MLVVGGGCCAVLRARRSRSRKIPVAMARGKHLFPFRTEQLSPSAPMVLGPQGPGRVGRRRFFREVGWAAFGRPTGVLATRVQRRLRSPAAIAALRLSLG